MNTETKHNPTIPCFKGHRDYAGECHCDTCEEIAQLKADKAELVAALENYREMQFNLIDACKTSKMDTLILRQCIYDAGIIADNLIAKHSKS